MIINYALFRCKTQSRKKRAVNPNADVVTDFDVAMNQIAGDEELSVESLENIVSAAVTQAISVNIQVGTETSIAVSGEPVVVISDTTTTAEGNCSLFHIFHV